VPGRFQGTTYPEYNSTSATVAAVTATSSELREWFDQDSRSDAGKPGSPDRATVFDRWVTAAGQVPANVPMWLSRPRWIATVCRWATTEEGRAVLKAHHVSYAMFCAVITVIARHAEGKTGRNVAVTRTRIAEEAAALLGKNRPLSVRSVTTIRQNILAAAGWAMEAKRGEGQCGGRYNRPSIWHLLSRAVCTLSCSASSGDLSPVLSPSPSAKRRRNSQPKNAKSTTVVSVPSIPADRHIQVLAGHLAGRCKGFKNVHPARLARVLVDSHLEVKSWTPAQLLDALDAQMAKNHFSWPDHIANPPGFLAHRLKGLPAGPPQLVATPIEPRFTAEDNPPTKTATAGGIASARALIDAAIIAKRRAAAA
jgi:hypothetical protein